MDFGFLLILGNALLLGIRHGIDWDHIAAIADIVGTTATTSDGSTISLSQRNNALRLSTFYALGHAAIVLVLGIAALMFATVLPIWLDPIMEKAVGITLLALGVWIFYSILHRQGDALFLQSRWMFLLSKLRGAAPEERMLNQYSAPAAFGIGVIHGFGAETGTQVLLIAAVGGSATHSLGGMILLSFILGLLISNTSIALLTCAGLMSAARFKPVLLAISILTGTFSLFIGTMFALGRSDLLPDLQR
jgi:high-affinity nickel-transport protein